jgi:hypothetical protein
MLKWQEPSGILAQDYGVSAVAEAWLVEDVVDRSLSPGTERAQRFRVLTLLGAFTLLFSYG